jgi:hypothetical protein
MSDSSNKQIKSITPKGSAPDKHVFLFDVDNTLLDNDRVTADLRHHLEKEVGSEGAHVIGRSSSSYGLNSVMLIISARCNVTAAKSTSIRGSSSFPIF